MNNITINNTNNATIDLVSTNKLSIFEVSMWLNDLLCLENSTVIIPTINNTGNTININNRIDSNNSNSNNVQISYPSNDININVSYFGCCRICGNILFDSTDTQRLHYKSDLHILNLKRSLQGLDYVNEIGDNVYENIDINEVDTDSDADSGLDGDVDGDVDEKESNKVSAQFIDKQKVVENMQYDEGIVYKTLNNVVGTHCAFVHKRFGHTHIKFHNSVLTQKKETTLTNSSSAAIPGITENPHPWSQLSAVLTGVQTSFVQHNDYWAVFLLQSGKFAAALYDTRKYALENLKANRNKIEIQSKFFGDTGMNTGAVAFTSAYNLHDVVALKHKVIKRYTIRAKAGGSQSSHDNQGK